MRKAQAVTFIGAIVMMIGVIWSVSNNVKNVENAEKDVAAAYADCIYAGVADTCEAENPGSKAMYEKHKEYADVKLQQNLIMYGD